MELKEKIDFWQQRAKEDFQVAEQQLDLKNFVWCLFFCHLALEKALKARVMATTKAEPPYLHDLLVLAQLAKLDLNEKVIADLRTITSFNLETRYEDYKQRLRKQANEDFTKQYLKVTQELLKWFLSQS